MADLGNIPFDVYTSNTPYNAESDAAPLHSLKQMVDAVNAHVEKISDEVKEARGNQSKLANRLNAGLENDGTIKIDENTEFAAENVEDQVSTPPSNSDRLLMTRGERDKLSLVSPKANRLLFVMGKSDPIQDGTMRIMLDDTLRGGIVPAGDGVYNLVLGSIFSGDRVHQHRKHVVLSYSDGVATFPESEDEIIPGSIEIFRNGQAIHSRNFTEVRDNNSGRIISIQFSDMITVDFDPSAELIWANYEIRPLTSGAANPFSSLASVLDRFDKTLEASDVHMVNLPLEDPSQRPWQFWMIDVTELGLKTPYDNCLLLLTPGTREDGSGHQLYSYGVDWDVVTISGSTYLRWRYDRNPGATDGIPASNLHPERWSFITETGAGTPESPATGFATFDLVAGAHVELFYPS